MRWFVVAVVVCGVHGLMCKKFHRISSPALQSGQLEEEVGAMNTHLYSSHPTAQKARLATTNVHRPVAEAKELKITVGPDTHATSASKLCYFEADRACRFTAKDGVCHVDGRPCGSNRAYLDHVYSSSSSGHKARLGKDPFAHLQPPSYARNPIRAMPPGGLDFVQRGAGRAQSFPADPLHGRHMNSGDHHGGADVAATTEAHASERPTDEQRHQALSDYFSTDPQGEFLREVGAPPTTYPSRFLYDIVSTVRLGLYIVRLVVNVVVAAVDDTARRSILFVTNKDVARPLDE